MIRAVPVLALLALSAVAPPDSWLPFRDHRATSPSGRRYVVIKKNGTGIRFELCARATGVRVLGPDRPDQPAAATPHRPPAPLIARDPLDTLLASGEYGQLPLRVVVPERLNGFLLYEQYGAIGRGKSVVWIDGAGKPTVELGLGDLFAELPQGTRQTVSSTRWNRGCFVDENAASIVVVAVDDSLREIAIKDGKVTIPEVARVAQWCARGGQKARELALEVASRGGAPLLRAVSSTAMATFHAEREPMALRLRAAVVLAAARTPVACASMFAEARRQGLWVVRRYAVRHLLDGVGPKALPDLVEMLCSEKTSLWGEAWQALASAGPVAAPSLMALVANRKHKVMGRSGAASALAVIGSRAALPVLLDTVGDPDEGLANSACNAAITIGGVDCRERLIAHLLAGTTQDGRIALFLRSHGTRAALPAIDAALARPQGEDDRKWLLSARAVCARATK